LKARLSRSTLQIAGGHTVLAWGFLPVILLEAHRLTVPLVRMTEPGFFSTTIKIISEGLIEAEWLAALGVCSSWAT
jgi:hypothetical protein